jgi:hypothetical protein
MRVLVCGGRDFNDASLVYSTLSELQRERGPISVLIHGAATGADTLAAAWGNDYLGRSCVHHYPAEWLKHGKAAGPIRNQQMLDEGKPDIVIAFPGGRGTADMVRRAMAAGIEVLIVAPGQK